MRTVLSFCFFTILFISCHKDKSNSTLPVGCDIQKAYADNLGKVTIINGVWGTVSLAEGDCMPTVPYNPCNKALSRKANGKNL
jgi:hypothetical protein